MQQTTNPDVKLVARKVLFKRLHPGLIEEMEAALSKLDNPFLRLQLDHFKKHGTIKEGYIGTIRQAIEILYNETRRVEGCTLTAGTRANLTLTVTKIQYVAVKGGDIKYVMFYDQYTNIIIWNMPPATPFPYKLKDTISCNALITQVAKSLYSTRECLYKERVYYIRSPRFFGLLQKEGNAQAEVA